MVIVTLATRLPYLGHPAAEFDEQLYSLIGAQMHHGLLPYTDLWDRKPIGLFLIYALAHALGGDGPIAYQVLALLACLIGGWQVWHLGLRITDRLTAALASALYPILMALFDCYSGQSEIFFVPVMLAMAQVLLAAAANPLPRARHLCMAAMACGGVALQIKYTVLMQCLFFGGCALWLLRRQGRSNFGLVLDAGLFAGLGLLPTALAAAYYGINGLLPDFVFANFQSIGLRAAMPLSRIWQEQAVFAVPLLALSGGGILFALRMRPGGASREWQLSLAWLLASAFGLFMASTIYFYAYGALVPGAILTALPMFDRRHSWGLVIWSVIILGMVAGYDLPGRISGAREERAALADMARVLAPQVAGQSHCLYVFDGPTALYRLTGSGLPTRLIYPDHLNNALEAKALPVDPAQELERIFAQRPGAVVTSPDPVTVQNPATNAIVSRELATHYRALGRWKFRDRRLDLFARQPDADGLQPPCRRK